MIRARVADVVVGAAALVLLGSAVPARGAEVRDTPVGKPLDVLVYDTVNRDGVSTLTVADATGGRERRFAATVHVLGRPAVSPTGSGIAVSLDLGEDIGRYGIGLLSYGGHLRLLTRPAIADRDPAFAPDGSYVLAVRVGHPFGQPGAGRLVRIPVDGGAVSVVPGVSGALRDPTVSPDGTRIAFVSGTQLETVGAAGGPPRVRLRGLGLGEPAWSPDGQSIAVVQRKAPGQSLLRLVSLIRASTRTLAHVPGLDGPHWDSDGRGLVALVFSGVGDGGRRGQSLAHITTRGALRRIVAVPALVHGLGRGTEYVPPEQEAP